jgi:hypothetical protein
MSVEIFLLPTPIEVEGISAEVAPVRRRLRSVGFYERAAAGFGNFIGPEEIERRQPHAVSDLMRGVPGIRVLGDVVMFRQSASRLRDENDAPLGVCEPNVWIDGIQMRRATPATAGGGSLDREDLGKGLEAYMNPTDVAAIEVYRRPSATPLQWGGLTAACGAIVIWTRGGPR